MLPLNADEERPSLMGHRAAGHEADRRSRRKWRDGFSSFEMRLSRFTGQIFSCRFLLDIAPKKR
jgi:hypothetical protein